MHPNIKGILGLIGRKNSGKDSVFKMAEELYARDHKIKWFPKRLAFADPLKELACVKLKLKPEELEARKNEPEIRSYLQELGVGRRQILPDFWLLKLWDRLEVLEPVVPALVIVTDVRFHNESRFLKKLGAKIVRIRRREADSIDDNHPSETELESIMDYDHFLHNDESLLRLKYNTLDILKTLWPDEI